METDINEDNGSDAQQNNGFDLGALAQQVVSRDEYSSQISQRDKKIASVTEQNIRNEEKIKQLSETLNQLQASIDATQRSEYQQSLALSEDEQEQIGDTLPVLDKLIKGSLSQEQERINNLESQVSSLLTALQGNKTLATNANQAYDNTSSLLDSMAKKVIGLDSVLSDEETVNYLKSTPYSQFGTRTLMDEINTLSSFKPGRTKEENETYNAAQQELSKIVNSVRDRNKSDVNATVSTGNVQGVKTTPQQEKLRNKAISLRDEWINHLNNGDTKSAFEAKRQLEKLAVEAKQLN